MNIAAFMVPSLGRLHAGRTVRAVLALRAPKRLRAAVAAAALLCGGLIPAAAAPFLPQSGAQVIETLPRRSDPMQQAVRHLQQRLGADPRNAVLAADIAQRYIALGRAESDPRYFGYAQAALAPWWQQAAPPVQVRLLRAVLLQASHRFVEALSDLDAVVAADPANAQAWLTRATVQTVRGEHSAAKASCARLSSLADQLTAVTCLANASAGEAAAMGGRGGASGAAGGATLALERLLQVALSHDAAAAPDDTRTWAQTLLAELAARRGDAASADQRFRTALAGAPRDSYLLGAYADFLLDVKRPAEAARLLQGHQRVDALLLRYALALKGQGRSAELVAATSELQARYDAARMRGDNVHQREQARFELELRNNPRAALALAQQNWQVQKEDADRRILLQAQQRSQ